MTGLISTTSSATENFQDRFLPLLSLMCIVKFNPYLWSNNKINDKTLETSYIRNCIV